VHSVREECVTEYISTRRLRKDNENLYVCKECINIYKECMTEFSDSKAQEE
jgi:hypothetical protein